MRSLVTGGSGFLGSALAMALAEKGDKVIILDRVKPGPSRLKNYDIEFFEADIRDKEKLDKTINGCDRVFHTAAMISFYRRLNLLQWDINVNGTKAVMEACLKHKVKKVIYTSSVNALGFSNDPSSPADENTPFNWQSYNIGYMNSKFAAEQLVLKMVKEENLPAIIVHPGTIFGPSISLNLGSNLYIIGIAKGKILAYPSGGTNCVSLEDVVNGEILAAERGRIGEKYILGGENLYYKQIFELIAEELGVKPPRFKLPTSFGLAIAYLFEFISFFTKKPPLISPEMIIASSICSFYSSEKARQELGYSFKPFKETIKETIAFLKASSIL